MTEVRVTPRVRPGLRRLAIVAVIVLAPFAGHAVWDQIESTLLARAIADIAGRGEPVNTSARSAPPPASEQRQSARLYRAAASLAQAQAVDDNFAMTTSKDVELPGADPRLDQAKLATYLAQAEPALHLLDIASGLDFKGFGAIAPELHQNESSLVTLSGMNNLAGDLRSVRGDGDLAAAALVESVRLQRTISIPFYRYLSVRRLYGSLRILLKRAPPGEEALRRLQSALEEWPDDDGLVAELQRLRAERLGEFWPYPPDRGSWALRPQLGFSHTEGPSGALAFLVFRPILSHVVRRQLEPFAEALAVARQPWPGKQASERALADRYRIQDARTFRSRSFLRTALDLSATALGVWALDSALPAGGMNLAFRRTAIAAVAVERFRRRHDHQAPPSLEALVPEYLAAVPQDPFDGAPVRYRLEGDGYVVYSVDVNGVDDRGALYGFGSGVPGRGRPIRDDPTPRDIGIRVPLTPQH
jgi:hypothetical protein